MGDLGLENGPESVASAGALDGPADRGVAIHRSNPYIAYVADPMCSWCWGFDPVLEALLAHLSGRVTVELVLGGLRPGPAARPLDELRDVLRATWRRIATISGQPFDESGLERTDWLYDTDPPSRAVCAVRSIEPARALPAFGRLQRAFYAEARDVTDTEVLVDALADLVEPERFRAAFERADASDDYRLARALGATGFPSLFGARDGGWTALVRGYVPWSELAVRIDGFLGSRSN